MLHTFSIKLKTLSEVHTLSKAPNRGRGEGGFFFWFGNDNGRRGDIRILLGWGKFLFEIQITKKKCDGQVFFKKKCDGQVFFEKKCNGQVFFKKKCDGISFFHKL